MMKIFPLIVAVLILLGILKWSGYSAGERVSANGAWLEVESTEQERVEQETARHRRALFTRREPAALAGSLLVDGEGGIRTPISVSKTEFSTTPSGFH